MRDGRAHVVDRRLELVARAIGTHGIAGAAVIEAQHRHPAGGQAVRQIPHATMTPNGFVSKSVAQDDAPRPVARMQPSEPSAKYDRSHFLLGIGEEWIRRPSAELLNRSAAGRQIARGKRSPIR
ncbi:hypothetical protein BCEP4_450021 [Burkholderia cepacia]|nr:hypothetical protein BCEP4_450021 [Burkholderia cepacia]